MYIVIICGGGGTRLWPLSTQTKPKQFLKLAGNSRTMLQLTYDRAAMVTDNSKILCVSMPSYAEEIRNQLPELEHANILVEPERRGTSGSIILALAQLKSQNIDPNEPVVFLWSDGYMSKVEKFTDLLKEMEQVSLQNEAIVYVGAVPTYPATKFGYIKIANQIEGHPNFYEFKEFKEKPEAELAQSFYDSGQYLWNMGYLVGSINTFERKMDQYASKFKTKYQNLINADRDNLEEAFKQFDNIAIDYDFSELIHDALVARADVGWMDLGSFDDLHDVVLQDQNGNYIEGSNIAVEEVNSSYIHNETQLPVAVIGLENVVVAVTDSGVLVTSKNVSAKVGDVSKRLTNK